MKKIEFKARKLLREIFKGVSFTSLAFVFQACYGPAPDEKQDCDLLFNGVVVSKSTSLPIEGVKVVIEDGIRYGYTDTNGRYNIDFAYPGFSGDGLKIHFQNATNTQNIHFADTTIVVKCRYDEQVITNVELRELTDD
jgi:hypothetical protein